MPPEDVRPEDVRAGCLRTGHLRPGRVRTGHLRPEALRPAGSAACLPPGHLRSGHVRAGRLRTGHVRAGRSSSGPRCRSGSAPGPQGLVRVGIVRIAPAPVPRRRLGRCIGSRPSSLKNALLPPPDGPTVIPDLPSVLGRSGFFAPVWTTADPVAALARRSASPVFAPICGPTLDKVQGPRPLKSGGPSQRPGPAHSWRSGTGP